MKRIGDEDNYPFKMILNRRRNLTEVFKRIIAPASATRLRIEEGRERIHDFAFFFCFCFLALLENNNEDITEKERLFGIYRTL